MDSMRSLFHVHLGAGSFGLGFVAYFGHKIGMQVVLVNRTSQDEKSAKRNDGLERRKEYKVNILSDTVSSEYIPIHEFLYMDRSRSELIQRVTDSSTVLLTTALRTGLENCVPLIAEMIVARVRAAVDTRLFVMACENRLDSSWLYESVRTACREEEVREGIERHVSFVPCVVDRICTKSRYIVDEDKVIVDTEPYAKWIIQRSDHTGELEELLAPLIGDEVVEFVDSVDPYKLRKRWLVNGPQLLAAILAKAVGETGIHRFLRTPANAELFREIQEEALEGVVISTNGFFSRTELSELNATLRSRFRKYPDTTARLLSQLQRPTLEGFFSDLWDRVGEPVRVVLSARQGTKMTETVRVVFEAVRMVHDKEYVET